MEGRCQVETWAEFGFSGPSCTPNIRFGLETHVIICSGRDEVHVFSSQERKVTAVLQFPAPVTDLVKSHDRQLLYAACRSGVYCVSLQPLLSRAPSFPGDASSCPAELKVSSEFLAVADEGVLSLLLVDSVLLTLCQREATWILSLYKSSNYEMLGSFSLPLLSGVVYDDTERKTALRRRPLLICVHSSDLTPPSPPSASSSEAALSEAHYRLEPLLFKLLFGIDAALAKSPVILCGLPDGYLCFLPLRLPGTSLRVLHNLEQPIVFVGASVVMETGQGHAQCLVALGELGRVVLIKTDKEGSEGGGSRPGFTEGCVQGPVMCGHVDKKCLYYSTGSDLLLLDLSEASCGMPGAALHSPTSLNVCRVVALAEPTCSSAGEVQLLGLSVRGQLQRITLAVGREDGRLSKVSSIQVGHSVRDLLSAIGDVCERASVLKTAIKSKNQILRQLNQVLNISILLMASTDNEKPRPVQEKAISCHAVTSWSRLLQKDSLNLTCILNNSSPYVLERGWTLSITVFPLSLPLDAEGQHSSGHFSFPFHNLHPGETFEASLPLADAGEASFPMTVSCSLVFSLTGLLGNEVVKLPGLQHSCISLPLNTLMVDWLHALQVNSPSSTHSQAASQSNDVHAFLRSRHIAACAGGGESASKPEEQYSARVHISSELLRDTLVLHGDAQGTKLAPQNVCLSLLEWLFESEGLGGVKTSRHQGDKITLSIPVVHARGLNGHSVKLTAKQVNAEEECQTPVEVQVESSSMAAVCGLHHAVLRRLLALLQAPPSRAAPMKTEQSWALRQALQRAEHLLQQIQQSRISGAYGVGVATGQMTTSLLCVYRELRSNPLLII